MIRLFATAAGLVLEQASAYRLVRKSLTMDEIFASENPVGLVQASFNEGVVCEAPTGLLTPIQSQEVWAAGVTYYRSRTARMEESKESGGDSFYDKVYEAERPELFFKSVAHRVAVPGGPVLIRTDSKWNVPEPEFTLAVSKAGEIFGFTIGNDMSSRSIEGENPLYLPQAKVYDLSAAIGPCLVVTAELPPPTTVIAIAIHRAGAEVFAGETTLDQIKRALPSLPEWLYRDQSFPHGCYLMTGTGVVPDDSFTLEPGDEIRITIEPIGTLVNFVQRNS
jgi:2-dehydro-3-deoxy-D-arabinonate dehydratase